MGASHPAAEGGPAAVSDDRLPEGWVESSLVKICGLNPPKPVIDFLPPEADVTFAPMPAVDADSGTLAAPEIRPFAKVRIARTRHPNSLLAARRFQHLD